MFIIDFTKTVLCFNALQFDLMIFLRALQYLKGVSQAKAMLIFKGIFDLKQTL
jgi:hypothetical protein